MKRKTKDQTEFFYKKVVKIPMFYGNFIIIFSNEEEKVKKITNYRGSMEEFAFTFHNFLYKGQESIAVCFNFWTSEPVTLGTIMHEVNHAGNRLLLSRNVEPDFENDEAESYVKGWLADQIQDFMKKCNIV